MPSQRPEGRTRGTRRAFLDPGYEKRIQDALNAVRVDGLSYQKAAGEYNVALSTLKDRGKGTHVGWKERAQARQKITPRQEDVLVEWAADKASKGIPYTTQGLRKEAAQIAGGAHMGQKWSRKFMNRHRTLKAARSTKLDPARAQNFNQTVVNDFFDKFQSLHDKHGGIPSEHIWNMDEKGIQMGGGRKNDGRKHLFPVDQKLRYQISSDNLELVTVVEAVSAAGARCPPSFVLTPGPLPDLRELEDGAFGSIYQGDKGWTDDAHAEQWLEHVFVPFAAERRVDTSKPIVLLMDGHGSHECVLMRDAVYRILDTQDIEAVIFCFPSKCTHRMQPLDVGVFSPVGRKWRTHCDHLAIHAEPVNRYTVITEYLKVMDSCITAELIQSAFRLTGIHPFNRDVFKPKDFAPSKVFSSQAHVPEVYPDNLPLSDPIYPTDDDYLPPSSDVEYMEFSDTEPLDQGPDDSMETVATMTQLPDEPEFDYSGEPDNQEPDNSMETVTITQSPDEPELDCSARDEAEELPNSNVSGLHDNLANIDHSLVEKLVRTTRASLSDIERQLSPPRAIELEEDRSLDADGRLATIRELRQQQWILYQLFSVCRAELSAANAHCSAAKNEIADVQKRLAYEQAKKQRKGKKTKGRFVTQKDWKGDWAVAKEKAEEAERIAEEKRIQKSAEQHQRELRIFSNSQTKIFDQPLKSLRKKEDLETLAFALGLERAGTIADLTENIQKHLSKKSDELKTGPRFSGLFNTTSGRTGRQDTQASSSNHQNGSVVPSSSTIPTPAHAINGFIPPHPLPTYPPINPIFSWPSTMSTELGHANIGFPLYGPSPLAYMAPPHTPYPVCPDFPRPS